MFLNDLFEAPIANIYTHGDFSQPGSLRADDLSLATPKRQEKIVRVLRKSPIEIDLHFVNLAAPAVNAQGHFDIRFYLGEYPERFGYVSPARMKEWWLEITPRPDALNLVLVENEGADRLPLTPWIIAHRLSHAFQYAEPLLHTKIYNLFLSALDKVISAYLPLIDRLWGSVNYDVLAPIFGTTRATREGLIKAGRVGEWFHDCFAQMCITGDIRFNAAPAELLDYPGKQAAADKALAKLRVQMLDYFHQMLNNSVGKIILF